MRNNKIIITLTFHSNNINLSIHFKYPTISGWQLLPIFCANNHHQNEYKLKWFKNTLHVHHFCEAGKIKFSWLSLEKYNFAHFLRKIVFFCPIMADICFIRKVFLGKKNIYNLKKEREKKKELCWYFEVIFGQMYTFPRAKEHVLWGQKRRWKVTFSRTRSLRWLISGVVRGRRI